MSLDISKLEHVRGRGKKTIARCPACAEAGEDRKGEHLLINEDGSFGCIIHPGNSPEAKAHRKQIFALCGDREIRPLKVSRRSKYTPIDGILQSISCHIEAVCVKILEDGKPYSIGPKPPKLLGKTHHSLNWPACSCVFITLPASS